MPEISIRAFLVSVVVIRETDGCCEVLLLKRTGSLAGTWCQVAGSIEDNETAWQAALRELNEVVMNDDRVDHVMLPFADGVTLVRKKK